MKALASTASFLAVWLSVSGLANAADMDSLVAECESCHGPQGQSGHSDVPIIGGQSAKYIKASLMSYKQWGRPCVKSARRYGDTSRPPSNMCEITENLGSGDIQALSDHFSAMAFVSARQDFDAAKAVDGASLHDELCESCHEQGASSVTSRGPRLAGQWMDYLVAGMKYIPTGEHLVPPAMESKIGNLSDDDLDKLMHFYASQQD